MGVTAGVFHKKLKKNDMRTLFSENGRFLTKYRHENSVFLENEPFFNKIWA